MSETLEQTSAPVEAPSEAPTDTAPSTDQPKAGDSLRDVITRAYQESTKGDRARDDNGRFTGSGAAPEAPQAEPATTQASDQPSASAPASERPAAWSETEWNGLSPEARSVVARRERDHIAALEQRAENSQEIERYRKAIEPHSRRFHELGVTPPEAFARLLEWESAIRENPADALPKLAKAMGFDFRTLAHADHQQSPQQQEFRDPRVDRMIAEQERERIAAEQREAVRVAAQIDAFKADSKNVHFEAVRGVMARLISADQDLSIEDAYDRAVWADPKLRAERVKAEAERVAAERAKEEAARAKAARSASISVRDSAPSGVNGHSLNTKGMSLRETLQSAYRSQAG